MAVRQEQMATPAHGHIIEGPEEDFSSGEIKRESKKTARKPGRRDGGRREERAGKNMLGYHTAACLQFIINFLEPSQSYGRGAHANRIIPFHWQM